MNPESYASMIFFIYRSLKINQVRFVYVKFMTSMMSSIFLSGLKKYILYFSRFFVAFERFLQYIYVLTELSFLNTKACIIFLTCTVGKLL